MLSINNLIVNKYYGNLFDQIQLLPNKSSASLLKTCS